MNPHIVTNPGQENENNSFSLESEPRKAQLYEAELSVRKFYRLARVLTAGVTQEPDGLLRLPIPNGLSDITAMKALNVFARVNFSPNVRRTIWSNDIQIYYENDLRSFAIDDRKAKILEVYPLVPGSGNHTRDEQQKILSKQALVFSPPHHLVLVITAFACKMKSIDILGKIQVRTAAPEMMLAAHSVCGLALYGSNDDKRRLDLLAAGSRVLQPKV